MSQTSKDELHDRMAKYYAWKLVIGQVERIVLPEIRQAEADAVSACRGRTDLLPNLAAGMLTSRRVFLEEGLQDLRGRFIALFGAYRLASP